MGKPGFPMPLLEGYALPDPPAGGGMGKPGFPMPLLEGYALPDPPTGWGDGETRFPHPPARGLRPPRPSHRVGGWGNPVSPCPCSRATPSQTLPPGGGMGKPGFPTPLRKGCALTFPRAGAWGNPVSPRPRGLCSRQAPFAGRTTPDDNGPGARAAHPRHVSAGKVTAPLPSPPPAGGRESGSSPQRGEVRRGAAAPHARR